MVKLNGSTVELTKARDLTAKQLARLNQLDGDSRSKYLLSILGLSKSRVHFAKPDAGHDSLSAKRAGSVQNTLRNMRDASADKEHKPISRKDGSFWVGVEVECLFQGDSDSDECETCNGSGEETCHNCDGRGHINLEDDNGNEYRVDCASCDGRGVRECGDCDGNSGSSDGSRIRSNIRTTLEREGITLCSVRDDGSLGGDGYIGVEVTVLFNAAHGFDKLYKVCKILNKAGATVDSSCGLHVHIDQGLQTREESLAIGRQFGKFLPILGKLVPASRRNNRFCALAVSEVRGERYFAVNMTSLTKHKTIEIRLHSGTTDASKIQNWVTLLQAIVNGPRVTHKIETFQGLIDSLKLNAELVEYFDRRFSKFNPEITFAGDAEIHDDESQGVAV